MRYSFHHLLTIFIARVSKILPKSVKDILRPIMLPIYRWYTKRKSFNFFSYFINKGDLVFDIGANIGSMTEIFLKLGASKVICVEPQKDFIKILKGKFYNNKKVAIIEKGLGSKNGVMQFFINKNKPDLSTFSEKWKLERHLNDKWKEPINISVTTLDELIKEFRVPAFCKIDVEGTELDVLRGLSSKIRFISFEFTGEFLEDANLCINYILSLAEKSKFNFSLSTHSQIKMGSKKWIEAEQLLSLLKSIPDKDLKGDIYAELK